MSTDHTGITICISAPFSSTSLSLKPFIFLFPSEVVFSSSEFLKYLPVKSLHRYSSSDTPAETITQQCCIYKSGC